MRFVYGKCIKRTWFDLNRLMCIVREDLITTFWENSHYIVKIFDKTVSFNDNRRCYYDSKCKLFLYFFKYFSQIIQATLSLDVYTKKNKS